MERIHECQGVLNMLIAGVLYRLNRNGYPVTGAWISRSLDHAQNFPETISMTDVDGYGALGDENKGSDPASRIRSGSCVDCRNLDSDHELS